MTYRILIEELYSITPANWATAETITCESAEAAATLTVEQDCDLFGDLYTVHVQSPDGSVDVFEVERCWTYTARSKP
jgi:hypothetical protein